MFRSSLVLLAACAFSPWLGGCSAADGTLDLGDGVYEPAELDGPEPDEGATPGGATPLPAMTGTVEQAISGGCSTTSVKGLSEQIVAQMNCLVPDALAALPARSNLTESAATFAYLQPKAKDALVAALDANPSKSLSINSMLRTVAQQYVLYRWSQTGRCGIALAATPGRSNHESGLALDTSEYSSWRAALEARAFAWFGSADKVHFDYAGSGKSDLRGIDVKAFQMLWNVNHPDDPIGEDGSYGSKTATRLSKSPAGGFPIGASCAAPPPDPDPEPPPAPPPQPAPQPQPPAGVGRALGVVWDLSTGSSPAASGSARIGTATVWMDGGAPSAVRASDAYWQLPLAVGSYTLHAAAPGFRSASKLVQIAANEDSWASIGLSPE